MKEFRDRIYTGDLYKKVTKHWVSLRLCVTREEIDSWGSFLPEKYSYYLPEIMNTRHKANRRLVKVSDARAFFGSIKNLQEYLGPGSKVWRKYLYLSELESCKVLLNYPFIPAINFFQANETDIPIFKE